MALFPPSELLEPLEPQICWESGLLLLVDDRIIPVHRGILSEKKSRFLTQLFDPMTETETGASAEAPSASASAEASAPIPIDPPAPKLFVRALHAITVGSRPEVTEAEFVGFVRTAAYLQSDELEHRLCEVGLASWRKLTQSAVFRNPDVPAVFLDRFLRFAREKGFMTASEALDALALWCMHDIVGGQAVLEGLVDVQDMEATELRRLEQLNPRFVELLSPVAVFQIMKRGMDSFI